ncbi:DUF6167 family protein [uncultured Pseudokineococcus sp.]|uniref:DUF6167 family protein n=1 Tax=uncultured Pseudokineococcus sp. TaxID=1642928 RepID=UPI002634941B|nr:DUF6167 family protein [uncultured Pseudokineococcus sp.]
MGRLVWIGFGAVAGVVAVRRAAGVARSYTPKGLHGRATGWSEAARSFAAEVRAGAAEREQELRVALGVDAGAMSETEARDLIERPTSPRA